MDTTTVMRAILPTTLPLRPDDKYGSGRFGSTRTKRMSDGTVKKYTHKGQDYSISPGEQIMAPVHGRVSKQGYVYSDDLSFRYIRIITDDHKQYDVYYVDSPLPVGRIVNEFTIIGLSQSLQGRYPGITDHIQLSIKVDGVYVDPESL